MDREDIEALRERIFAGEFPEMPDDIRIAHALKSGDLAVDVRAWVETLPATMELSPKQSEALAALRDSGGGAAELLDAHDAFADDFVALDRLDIYLAIRGHRAAADRELSQCVRYRQLDTKAEYLRRLVWGFGVHALAYNDTKTSERHMLVSAVGLQRLVSIFEYAAPEIISAAGGAETTFLKLLEDVSKSASPARQMTDATNTSPTTMKVEKPGVTVVPWFEMPKGDRAAPKKAIHKVAGSRLPLFPTGDVSTHLRTLTSRSPHLAEIYDAVLSDTAQSASARFRPTILVGPPGTGKSASARDLAGVMGLPITTYPVGGVSDGTFGGTAAHWSSSGPSVPLNFIISCRAANPIIVLDEIDKAGTGDQNGRLVDALLGFLDRGNAASYRDPCLELAVDLSHVSYILTANSLDGIPPPLRDRCRILCVPNPSVEHVPVLVRGIISDIAAERGLDARWFEPLAEDEMSVVREGWGGGSIRRLRRAVETALSVRERMRGYQ